jgi:hypothetical protein
VAGEEASSTDTQASVEPASDETVVVDAPDEGAGADAVVGSAHLEAEPDVAEGASALAADEADVVDDEGSA